MRREPIAVRVGAYYLTDSGVPCRCSYRWGNSYTMHSVWGPQSFLVDGDGSCIELGMSLAREISKPPEDAPNRSLMDIIGQAVIEGRKAYEGILSFVRSEESFSDAS